MKQREDSTLLKLNQSPASLAEAIAHFQRAIEIDPNRYLAYDALAYIYAHLGDQAKALEDHNKAEAIRKKLGID